MSYFVVDTNVCVVAKSLDDDVSDDCKLACIDKLKEIVREAVIILDEGGRILSEYKSNLSPAGDKDVASAFLKHIYQNQWNEEFCRCFPITPTDDNTSFEEFPNDPELQKFDLDDRKFVAVALASELEPAILNAVDSDWWDHRNALAANGVNVIFLCPERFAIEG